MRIGLVVAVLIASVCVHSAPLDDLIIKKNSIANDVVIMSGIISDTTADNNNKELAQKICLAGGIKPDKCVSNGGYYGYGPKTIAQGICFAGGIKPDKCMSNGGYYGYGPKTIAQGICFAGGIKPDKCMSNGGYYGYGPKNISEALELIAESGTDRYWYWDEFRDQYGNSQWRCRGSQTGRFANNSNCSGQSKDDKRWPG